MRRLKILLTDNGVIRFDSKDKFNNDEFIDFAAALLRVVHTNGVRKKQVIALVEKAVNAMKEEVK